MLFRSTDSNAWELQVVEGAGGPGFTWDGTYLTTPQPMPTEAPPV